MRPNLPSDTVCCEVIIPAFNEQDSIGRIIAGVREAAGQAARIVVVDDASTDKTAEMARQAGATVLHHPYRIGNGACIKTGLRNASAEIVVLMDADGQHRPEDIPALLQYAGSFDMVVGARDFSRLQWRSIANRIYNLCASYVTGFRICDLTSGFRVFRRATACKFLYLLPNEFSYPTTLTLSFLKTGRTVKYIPIVSGGRRHGKSKIRLVRDGIRFMLIIVKIAVFFSPLKVFVPASAFFFCCGLAYYAYTYSFAHRFTNMGLLLFVTSLFIFMLGLISEQINQLRFDRTEG